jgi:hypothetical protein
LRRLGGAAFCNANVFFVSIRRIKKSPGQGWPEPNDFQ